MVNMNSWVFMVSVLAVTVLSDYCMNEKNDFRVVEVELAESASFPEQALVTLTGFFQSPQHVTMMTFDYTLDGFNWQRAIKKFDEDFQADVFSVFMVPISFDGSLSSDAKAVVGFSEDNEMLWCTVVDLIDTYNKRRLIS